MLFASNHFGNQLPISTSHYSFQFQRTLDINYINQNKHSMPSKKRITRVCFTDSSRTANQTLGLRVHLEPQINGLIPQVLFAAQVLPESKLQHPQSRFLMSAPPIT